MHLGQLEISLIRENPNLEELRIHYFNQDLAVTYGGALIASAHWPKLRILELSELPPLCIFFSVRLHSVLFPLLILEHNF